MFGENAVCQNTNTQPTKCFKKPVENLTTNSLVDFICKKGLSNNENIDLIKAKEFIVAFLMLFRFFFLYNFQYKMNFSFNKHQITGKFQFFSFRTRFARILDCNHSPNKY